MSLKEKNGSPTGKRGCEYSLTGSLRTISAEMYETIDKFLESYRVGIRRESLKSLYSKVIPFWMLFLLHDYWYAPDQFWVFLVIRCLIALFWIGIYWMEKFRPFSEEMALMATLVTVYALTGFVYLKDSVNSPYIIAILITLVCSKYVFQYYCHPDHSGLL